MVADGQRSDFLAQVTGHFEETKPLSAGDPSYYTDIVAALENAWTCLQTGATNRRSAFHTMTVATLQEDGWPALRTVVLRRFERPLRQVTFHTDIRSRKYAELLRRPHFAAHFYDPGFKVQLRLQCLAALHHDDEVSRVAWAEARPMSRECYGQAISPGLPLETPAGAESDWMEDSQAYPNFAVISGEIVFFGLAVSCSLRPSPGEFRLA